MNTFLRPETVWIEGRCYRVSDPSSELSAMEEHGLYQEEDIPQNEGVVDEDDDDYEIERIDDTRFSTRFHISKPYIGAIIGKKGAMKSRIEHETKTELKIPRHDQSGDITINGSSAMNVKAARRRINIIVMSSRIKQRPTHFISIPLNTSEIMLNFEKFRETVLRECLDRGVEECIFNSPRKLHITVGVMALMDDEERTVASNLLEEAKDKIVRPLLQNTPLKIRVKGLSYMNDDPKEIAVLYSMVTEDKAPQGILQKLADDLVDHFYKAGYMNAHEFGRDHVNLHVTLMNTKFKVSRNLNSVQTWRSRRETFDGSNILDKFADYDFGVVELSDIHLSVMHSDEHDQYYKNHLVTELLETVRKPHSISGD